MTAAGSVPLLVTTTGATLSLLGAAAVGAMLGGAWSRLASAGRTAIRVAPDGAGDGVSNDTASNDTASNDTASNDRHDFSPPTRGRRIERALGALPLGVIVTDTDGVVIYRNRFAEQFRGARHGNALVEAELNEVVAATVVGRAVERSVEIYGPPPRSLELRGSPTVDDGVQTGSVVVIEDVTAAQHVDRVRKDFVANVSHELRTPVGAIGVLAETLCRADDAAVVDRLAQRLQNEAMRLGDMIEDLLELSTLESGEISEPDLVDLHRVIELAFDRAAAAAERRRVTMNRTGATDGPVFVEGDRRQMIAAVSNLLDNAIKYSGEHSEVVVELDRRHPSAVVRVIDTGVGVPESDLDRIFERFYRVDGARSRDTGGTGLGLSIVRHVAMNHRGTIAVASEEGSGSTFTLTLPLSSVHRPASAPESTHG